MLYSRTSLIELGCTAASCIARAVGVKAGVAQLVERNLAKVEVESSRLFSRSKFWQKPDQKIRLFSCPTTLIKLRARRLDDLAPTLHFAFDKRSELSARYVRKLSAISRPHRANRLVLG